MPKDHPHLYCIGHAHIDPVWLWQWPEGLATIRATWRSALDRVAEYPDFRFVASSVAFYGMLRQVDPEMFDEVKRRVAEGRWEVVGGWWVEPDANIPCGESLVRQALYGQRFLREHFGITCDIGFNPDTFGHPGTLPQILRGTGFTRYVFMRPSPHEKELPGNLFRWRSPDGSEVLAVRLRDYGSWAEGLDEKLEHADEFRPPYVSDYVCFYGVGDHGGGPTNANIESLQGRDDAKMSTLKAFFESVEAELGPDVPVVADELQHHARGCYTSHSEIKRQNRRAEHLLMSAERWGAVASLLGKPARSLRGAWEPVLFSQFHDVLAGTSIPQAYDDARDAFGKAAAEANYALHSSIQYVAGRIDTRGEGEPLVVFNPLPWSATVPVEVELCSPPIGGVVAQDVPPGAISGTHRTCFVAELPALGYRVFQRGVDGPTPGSPVTAGATSLENKFWRLEMDPATGDLIHLFDKRNSLEVFAGPANVLQVLDDRGDTWGHGFDTLGDEIGRFGSAKFAVEEQGPVRSAIRCDMRWGKSLATMRVYLYAELDFIEFRLTVNWQEQGRALKVLFPVRLQDPKATYEAAYGCIERATDAKEQPGQQWLDVTGTLAGKPYGVALLNDSKYGFDVAPWAMRMSILRSPAYAQHDPHKPLPGSAPVYLDQGLQTVVYRLVPHACTWQEAGIPRRAWELNVPPVGVNEYQHAGPLPLSASFLETDAPNVLLTVLKPAENGDGLIVRGYETDGIATKATVRLLFSGVEWTAEVPAHGIKSFRVDPSAKSATEVNLLEDPLA